MDFVALDFETANSRADSACQLAMVTVRAGELVDEHCWLIKPPKLYFSPRNISIHGIRPEHVARAPTIEQLWPKLSQLIDGQVLVAHNATFDIGVLVASLAAFEIATPHLEFACTRAIARRAWPGRSRYGLKPLGDWLGVQFKHHDALEDARCCAQIALTAAAGFEQAEFHDFEKHLRLSRGRYSLGRVTAPRTIGGRSIVPSSPSIFTKPASAAASVDSQPVTAARSANNVRMQSESPFTRARLPSRGGIDPAAIFEAAAGNLPLAHKGIVCLGSLRGMTLDETRRLIEALGGEFQTSITPQTNFVIACGGVLLEDANQMLAGANVATQIGTIRLLSERQFLSLLPGGKAAVRW